MVQEIPECGNARLPNAPVRWRLRAAGGFFTDFAAASTGGRRFFTDFAVASTGGRRFFTDSAVASGR